MQNIIALIWDFDKTLIDGYMQDPIFKDYGVDALQFWQEVEATPQIMLDKYDIKVNADTYYLNHFIKYAKSGKFKNLNNEKLKSYGTQLKFYPGIPDIFNATKNFVASIKGAKEFNLKLEHYIVSTGFRQVIEGSCVKDYVKQIWACELIDSQEDNCIGEIAYTIDHTTKTRALFEINKGATRYNNLDVNLKMPDQKRRIDFKNMIYIADGPSDVPAFSLIKKMGGSTFAVFPKGNYKALEQVERLRSEGRVDYYAEANYEKDTTAYMYLRTKIEELATRIIEQEKEKLKPSGSIPVHLKD